MHEDWPYWGISCRMAREMTLDAYLVLHNDLKRQRKKVVENGAKGRADRVSRNAAKVDPRRVGTPAAGSPSGRRKFRAAAGSCNASTRRAPCSPW